MPLKKKKRKKIQYVNFIVEHGTSMITLKVKCLYNIIIHIMLDYNVMFYASDRINNHVIVRHNVFHIKTQLFSFSYYTKMYKIIMICRDNALIILTYIVIIITLVKKY